MARSEEYTKTYTSFSGADIVASFNGVVVGNLQSITYSISREVAPIYVMGQVDPVSFSRGKRGCAGSLVFSVFDRDALLEALIEHGKASLQRFKANVISDRVPMGIDQWNKEMTSYLEGVDTSDPDNAQEILDRITDREVDATYIDQIPPFDITISFANEFGQRASQTIFGVQIMNEGSGYSIDSVITEKACSFVARKIEYLEQVD